MSVREKLAGRPAERSSMELNVNDPSELEMPSCRSPSARPQSRALKRWRLPIAFQIVSFAPSALQRESSVANDGPPPSVRLVMSVVTSEFELPA